MSRTMGLLPQVSAAHLVSHFHIMAVPGLLPLLPAALGVGFVELGFALAIFNIVSAVVQAPLGFAVDRFGARNVLLAGLGVTYREYLSGTQWLVTLLGPATVAFAIPIHQNRRLIRRHWVVLLAGTLVGSGIAMGSAWGLARATAAGTA